MKRLVRFLLKDNNVVTVEVDEPDTEGGVVRAGRTSDAIEQAGHTFEDALATIQPAAEAVIAHLRGLTEPPNQVCVEFGIKLNANAGAVIASTGVEANFKVSLSWKHGEKQRSSGLNPG